MLEGAKEFQKALRAPKALKNAPNQQKKFATSAKNRKRALKCAKKAQRAQHVLKRTKVRSKY